MTSLNGYSFNRRVIRRIALWRGPKLSREARRIARRMLGENDPLLTWNLELAIMGIERRVDRYQSLDEFEPDTLINLEN